MTEATPSTVEKKEIVVYARHLTKQFNGETAVKDVSFKIPRGTIFGLIGPSGGGKTTTVRLLIGLHQPTEGEVLVLGKQPKDFSQKLQARIGYMPQLFVLYQDLSVWENINFVASLYGVNLPRHKRLNRLLEFVQLSEHKTKLARDLSGGMQRRLSLAATLVHNPELLFLDEPTAGIDPVLRRKFWDHFKDLQDQGHTLLVTTQYVGEAAYCDFVGILSEGRLLMIDTPEGLRRRAYNGEVVDLRTAGRLEYSQLQEIRALPFAIDVTRIDNTIVRIIVDEASIAMPKLMEWCQARDIGVETMEEYLPPFDDVFVQLLEKETNHERNLEPVT